MHNRIVLIKFSYILIDVTAEAGHDVTRGTSGTRIARRIDVLTYVVAAKIALKYIVYYGLHITPAKML